MGFLRRTSVFALLLSCVDPEESGLATGGSAANNSTGVNGGGNASSSATDSTSGSGATGPCLCEPGTKLSCSTVCGSLGTTTCTEQCTIPNECEPPSEACNGVDDDCNGPPDDGFNCIAGTTVSCTTACGTTGTTDCDTTTCSPQSECTPPQEFCNGIDEDCDLVADDGLPAAGIERAIPAARLPVIASSPTSLAVAYAILGTPWTTHVQFTQLDGSPLSAATLVTTETAGIPEVAWNGSVYGVFWLDTYGGTGIYFRAYSADGTPVTPPKQLIAANAGVLSVTASGNEFLVAHDISDSGISTNFSILRVSGSGTVVSSVEIRQSPLGRVISPAFALGQAAPLIIWSEGNPALNIPYEIRARPLSTLGQPTGNQVTVRQGTLTSATSTPMAYAIAFQDGDSQLALLDSSGVQSGPAVTIASANRSVSLVGLQNGRLAVSLGSTLQIRSSTFAVEAEFETSGTPTPPNVTAVARLSTVPSGLASMYSFGGTPSFASYRVTGLLGCDNP